MAGRQGGKKTNTKGAKKTAEKDTQQKGGDGALFINNVQSVSEERQGPNGSFVTVGIRVGKHIEYDYVDPDTKKNPEGKAEHISVDVPNCMASVNVSDEKNVKRNVYKDEKTGEEKENISLAVSPTSKRTIQIDTGKKDAEGKTIYKNLPGFPMEKLADIHAKAMGCVFVNNISNEKCVDGPFESKDKPGEKYYNVGVSVPKDVSESGFANLKANESEVRWKNNGKTVNLVYHNDATRKVNVVKNGKKMEISGYSMADLAKQHAAAISDRSKENKNVAKQAAMAEGIAPSAPAEAEVQSEVD